MCGICGWVSNQKVDRSILETMIGALQHRGPDAQGIKVMGNVGLGHSRLSIIDLSEAANQPMSNEDDTIWLVYNGEFYTFQSYRENLIQKGHHFNSNTDSEVLLHLYEEYGPEFVLKMSGMFAFGLWDKKQNLLMLARDRVGIKPLYYFHQGTTFLFASEMKSLLLHPAISREIDPEALHAYFMFGYIPQNLSIFHCIRKLPAATYLIFKEGQIFINKYWNLPQGVNSYFTGAADEIERELLERLSEAVRMRLISDVPLGVFLSGGLDSSIVATLAASHTVEPIKTFSIGFEEQNFNELPFARMVAKHIGSDHKEFIVRIDETEIADDLAYFYDEPYADSSEIPTYYVSKIAREHVKVVLSGDGGDELFGGYNWYDWVLKVIKLHIFPQWFLSSVSHLSSHFRESYKGKHFLSVLSMDELNVFKERIGIFPDVLRNEILRIPFKEANIGGFEQFYLHSGKSPLSRMSRTDFSYYLPDDILTKVDRASMSVSLEARVPILDHKICEFAFSIPDKFKIKNGRRKYILKEIAKNLLPSGLKLERKQGFSVPLNRWMCGVVGDRVLDSVRQQGVSDIINPNLVEVLLRTHRQKNVDHSQKLWAVYMFALWAKRYL